jgi:DNA-binding NarL/FixJ family response regulator
MSRSAVRDENLERAVRIIGGASRVDHLKAELEVVGVDEFCRRRYTQDAPIPQRLSLALVRAPIHEEWELSRRVYATTWTERRTQALAMMAAGRSNKEIAAELRIGRAGATDLVRCVLSLLNATNRAHAIHLAHQQNLLS